MFMIAFGVVLLVLGFLFHIGVLWTVGLVLLLIGAALALLGATGHAIGGRAHYW